MTNLPLSVKQVLQTAQREGVDFLTYLEAMGRRLETGYRGVSPALDRNQQEFARLNYQRMQRNFKTYRPGRKVQQLVEQMKENQLWLVLTEDWCGDSAHSLPVLARLAQLNPLVDLRILHRDRHPDIMDLYLTDGKRSIPKWVVLDSGGRELFRWGPRPEPAAELFRQWRQEGLEKPAISLALQRWYNADKGKSLEREVVQWLERQDQQAA